MHDHSRRFRLFLERLEQERLDGYLITHPANLFYLFAFQGSSGLAYVVNGQAHLVVDSRYLEEARGRALNCLIELAEKSLFEFLSKQLEPHSGKRFGFEGGSLTQQDYALLGGATRAPAWIAGPGLVESLRQRKSEAELQVLQENFRLAQQALQESWAEWDPSLSEIQFAGVLEHEMRRVGAEGFAFQTIVASGPRSSLPHGVASGRIIGRDPLLVDFGLRRKGYCTDLTRMRADQPEVREIMKVVLDARQAAFDRIRPGVLCSEVDQAARDWIEEAGYGSYFGHSLGHGLGLEVHELPRIGPRQEVPIEAGMVFTLEPGIYRPGRFGVRLEDVVIVRDDGAEWISNPDRG